MSGRRPSLPPMPDLSHLTEEERKIIESVLQRQREEEEKEQEILRNLQDDFENYQASVKKLGEEGRQVQYGNQGAVCQICHKTKFADGIGHKCHYCGVRSCARCGGKVSLRSAKPGQKIQGQQPQIWACNLCKKKQELLVKTGQWYHGGMAKPVQLDVDTGSDTSSIRADPSPPHEKKPKFYERGAMGESQERMMAPDPGGMGYGPPGGPMGGPGGPPGPGRGGPHGHGGMQRAGSLHGKELKRQFSMSEVKDGRTAGPPGPGGMGPGGMGPPGPPHHGMDPRDPRYDPAMAGRGGRGMPLPHDRPGMRPGDPSRGPPRGDMENYPPPSGGMPPDGMERGRPPYDGMDPRDVGGGGMGYPPGGGPDRRLDNERRPDMMAGGEMMHHDMPLPGDNRMGGGMPRFDSQDQMRRRDDGRPRDPRDPLDRRREDLGDPSIVMRPDDPYNMGPDIMGDGRQPRVMPPGQADIGRYPDMPKDRYGPMEGLPDHQQHQQQQPLPQQQQQLQQQQQQQPQQQDRHRRGSVGRSRGDRMGHDLDNDRSRGVVEPHDPAAYGQDPGRTGAGADRHPERLMRGHAPVSPKDVDNTYDQYGGASGQTRRGNPPAGAAGAGTTTTDMSSRDHHNRHHRGRDDFHDVDMEMDRYHDQAQRQHLDPSSAVVKNSRSRRKLDSMLRNDSLSSDPSDCVRPPPPKPHKHKKGKNKPRHQASLSSSDDEIQTTPECTSCDEQEIESESVSEKVRQQGEKLCELIEEIYAPEENVPEKVVPEIVVQDNVVKDSTPPTDSANQDPLYGSHTDYRYDRDEHWKKDEILAAKIKKFLAHPVTWQPSADGKLIGHMILRKTVEGTAGDSGSVLGKGTLGLKVIGGKMTEQGYLGAFITKVKRGSIADTVGHLRPGDEVVEWNGRSLQGKTFEEVYDIIFESKQEPQVELIVRRSMSVGELPPGINEQDVEADEVQETYRPPRGRRHKRHDRMGNLYNHINNMSLETQVENNPHQSSRLKPKLHVLKQLLKRKKRKREPEEMVCINEEGCMNTQTESISEIDTDDSKVSRVNPSISSKESQDNPNMSTVTHAFSDINKMAIETGMILSQNIPQLENDIFRCEKCGHSTALNALLEKLGSEENVEVFIQKVREAQKERLSTNSEGGDLRFRNEPLKSQTDPDPVATFEDISISDEESPQDSDALSASRGLSSSLNGAATIALGLFAIGTNSSCNEDPESISAQSESSFIMNINKDSCSIDNNNGSFPIDINRKHSDAVDRQQEADRLALDPEDCENVNAVKRKRSKDLKRKFLKGLIPKRQHSKSTSDICTTTESEVYFAKPYTPYEV